MNINTIEQGIVDRLSPLRQAGLEVKALPDAIAKLVAPRGNGWVLVMFPEDNIAAPTQRFPLTQEGLLTCRLDIRLQSLRRANNENCWLVLKSVRQLLLGFQPNGARGPMYAAKQEMQGENQGYWHWFSSFQIPVLIRAEDPDSNEVDPLLKRITYLFELGDRWDEQTVDLSGNDAEKVIVDGEPS